MDKNLAKLVNEYGEELLPYLKLRAIYVTDYCIGDNMPLEACKGVTKPQITALSRTGLIKLLDGEIKLHNGDRWLCDPPVVKSAYVRKQQKSSGLDIYPVELINWSNILGVDTDFATNTGKYLSMYNRFKALKHNTKDIDNAIEYVKQEKDKGRRSSFTLPVFLSVRGFNYILSLTKNSKSADTVADRGEDDYVQEGW